MMRPVFLLVAAVAVAVPPAARADLPDADWVDRALLRLKARGLRPIPVYSEVPHQGRLDLNDGKVFGTVRILLPKGYERITTTSTSSGTVTTREPLKPGWQPLVGMDPRTNEVFVNCGWSVVTAEGHRLRPGDYVTYNGSKLVMGTLRGPDPVRREPRDTLREQAAERLSEALFSLGVKDVEAARTLFREVIREYPDTTSAERAVAKLQGLGESGPGRAPLDFVPESVFAKGDSESAEAAAARVLSTARFLKSSGQEEKAAEVVRGLIERYPGTKSAKRAREMLDALSAK
jgi:hypothetical protein